jgi:two-component system response regulator YcbB
VKNRFYIVDDDPAVRRMLASIITEMGLVVGESGSAREALAELDNCAVDVVVVDLLMPDMDGIELVRRLRPVCEAAFVMISQVQAKEMVGEAYGAGIEFFIHKPINSVEVRTVLARVCETQRLKSAVSHIFRSVSEVAGVTQSSEGHTQHVGQRIRSILHEIGIGGETGAKDLESAAVFLIQTDQGNTFSLKDLLTHLAGADPAAQKAAEQRMRRALQSALRHLAALGLEDYGNPRFEAYAALFFDFSEVRTEMRYLQGLSGHNGKVSLKRFLSALAHQGAK